MTLGTLVTLAIAGVLVVTGLRATWNYLSGNSSSCDGCSARKNGSCGGGKANCSVADRMVRDMESAAKGKSGKEARRQGA